MAFTPQISLRRNSSVSRAQPRSGSSSDHRVRRYQPGAGPDIRKGRTTPVVHIVGGQEPARSPGGLAPSGSGSSLELPPIGATPSAVQLASARAAAAARQPQRVQALGDAYGGGGGGRPKLPPALRKPTVAGRDGGSGSGARVRRPSSDRIPMHGVGAPPGPPAMPHRKGDMLPPAARSQAIAARLKGYPKGIS